MRSPPRGFAGLLSGFARLQRFAPVDRRQPARKTDPAATPPFVRRLITGLEKTGVFQSLRVIVVKFGPLRLALDAVGRDTQPGQIAFDPVGEPSLRTLPVGVVKPENEAPAGAFREQPVEQRGAGVADVDAAGGSRRETNRRHGV